MGELAEAVGLPLHICNDATAGWILILDPCTLYSGRKVRLKYPIVWVGLLRFKSTSQSVEVYYSAVSCALNMEVLISYNFHKSNN
jgi:hypothetical protein